VVETTMWDFYETIVTFSGQIELKRLPSWRNTYI